MIEICRLRNVVIFSKQFYQIVLLVAIQYQGSLKIKRLVD